MALEILMPQFDPDGTPGVVLRWLVAEGELVCEGDALAEVECHKTVLQLAAFGDGTLRKIVVKAGRAAWPHTILGILGGRDEPIDGLLAKAERQRADAPPPPRGNGRKRRRRGNQR